MQFNLAQARHNRDVAMERAGHNHAQWMATAKWTLIVIAKTHGEFTTDALWKLGLPPCPGTNRAIGPVMMAAAKAGIIERTNRTEQTSRVTNHARPLTVWRSKIYGAEQ